MGQLSSCWSYGIDVLIDPIEYGNVISHLYPKRNVDIVNLIM